MGRYYFLQTPQYIECITCGCYDVENVYRVHEGSPEGPEVFRMEEQSSCISRFCFLPRDRYYTITIFERGSKIGTCVRECNCSSFCPLCCCPPYIDVFNQSGQKIGKVALSVFAEDLRCRFTTRTFQGEDFLLWKTTTCSCHCHNCNPACCGPCEDMEFDIFDEGQNKLGYLRKYFSGMAQEWCTAADNYEFEFPNINLEDKEKVLLWLCTLSFIDYQFFEHKAKALCAPH